MKAPYADEIRKLVEKNEQGKSGIRILDESLVAFIEQGTSPFKSISLPRSDQIQTMALTLEKQTSDPMTLEEESKEEQITINGSAR